MEAIRIDRDVCADPEAARKLEWLETNGLGGFASSSILGWNTRRYHALLTAAIKPPVGRVVMLSKLEETLIIGGRRYELGTNRYPGAIHPEGFRSLREFRLDPFPIWTFDVDGVTVEKRVFMVDGENTTVIEYTVPAGAALELRALIAFRDYHATTHANDALNSHFETRDGVTELRPYPDQPAMYLAHNASSVDPGDGWYFHFEYDEERERGLDFVEDLFNPIVLRFSGSATVIASTEPHRALDAPELRTRELARRAAIVAAAPCTNALVERLTLAADAYLVQRGEFKTVVAGYHWFSDWGRDTMIALPGLTLVTRRYEIARRILLAFAESIDRGMLPNRFPDSGERPEYNTVDATLWFFEAARAYGEAIGDYDLLRELYPKLKEIVEWHLRGTRYGIRVDRDGLLACGEPGVQLTWMDAKVGDWVVTPRTGKPVEIQALWYNALRTLESLAGRFEDRSSQEFLGELAARARESFNAQFWNEPAGCLFDVVTADSRDAAIRPNQIFAISLPYRILDDDARARRALDVVERELLTPLGLRTLSPRDPQYRGRYEGDVISRDGAYHQGTVWPWLIGPFVTAHRRVNGDDSRTADWLRAFESHLQTSCLGQISEIADGDAPHTPRGCVAQAWSVAELLRVAVG
ncbi:MAG: putative glycogen debranching enzyme [Candidatus Solibacter sp.]|nr:putative glycogen debranching enzyme [Candidatus Solibacter sp.]